MTTKEIAQAVGKDERSVRRWVKKASDKMSVIADKMSVSSPMKPSDYDLEETLAIIEAGLGKNAAEIFRTNALNKPTREYVTRTEIVEIVAAVMAQVVPMITSQVNSQIQVRQIGNSPSHFSVLGFCNENRIKMGMPDMIRMGKECARISRERDVEIKKLPDERFGSVNAYHSDILREVFSV